VLFVTHSIAEAIKIGNRILLLSPHPGRVRAELNSASTLEHAAELEREIHELLFLEPLEEEAHA
jgi:NitT/TauT family transport system ATP-binding protein